MPQFVHVGVELQPVLLGRGTADPGVKHGAALALLALLVEHDAVQARAQVMLLRHQLPDAPLLQVAPQGKMLLHRRVQLGIAPGGVGPGRADIDDIVAGGGHHADARFTKGADHIDRAGAAARRQ